MSASSCRPCLSVTSLTAAIVWVLFAAIWGPACTSGDLMSSNSNVASSPSNTSVPVSQVGNTLTQGTTAQGAGLVLSLVEQPNLCIGVDTVAIGANLLLRPCDGSNNTLFSFANGQLRMNNTFCVGIPSEGLNPTALTVQDSLSLMTCDTSNGTQNFDIQPQSSFGITLANGTRWDLSTVSNYAVGGPVLVVPHRAATSEYRFSVAATSGGAAGPVGKFAVCSAAGDACIGLNSSGAPAVQPRNSASNLWQGTILGRLTDLQNRCLSFDSAGNMDLVQCSDAAAQGIATYKGQLWAQGPNMCISWGSSPAFASVHVNYVPCDQGTGTPMVWAPVP